MGEPRTREAEIDWRVQHWRLLNGEVIDFDADEFRRLEDRLIDHAGRHDNPAAHARADQTGLDRGAELADVTVPTPRGRGPRGSDQPAPRMLLTSPARSATPTWSRSLAWDTR
jgi:hypothetical protein